MKHLSLEMSLGNSTVDSCFKLTDVYSTETS